MAAFTALIVALYANYNFGIRAFVFSSAGPDLSDTADHLIRATAMSVSAALAAGLLFALVYRSVLFPSQQVRLRNILLLKGSKQSLETRVCVLGFDQAPVAHPIGDAKEGETRASLFEEQIMPALPYAWVLWTLAPFVPAILFYGPPLLTVRGSSSNSISEYAFYAAFVIQTVPLALYLLCEGFPFTSSLTVNPRRVVFTSFGLVKVFRPGKDQLLVGPVWGKSAWVRILLYSRRFGQTAIRVKVRDARHIVELWDRIKEPVETRP